jgi:beta-galactosidase
LLERLKQTALKHDPTRPTIYADNRLSDGVFLGTVFACDVLGINYMLETVDAFHSAYPKVRTLVSEHTNADSTLRGKVDLEKKQAQRISADLDIIEGRPYIAGSTLWSMHDYGTDYEPVWPIQRSGILDEYRNRKEAFYMMAARWSQRPVVHIASDWSLPHEDGEEVEVRVYTSCPTVELSLNGRSLGTKKGHNPVIWKVPYTLGTIRATGTWENAQKVTDSMGTPGDAVIVKLSGPAGMAADGKDAACLVARVTDDAGNTAPSYQYPILFQARGPVRLCGPGGSLAAIPSAGIASIVIRSTRRQGKALVVASTQGLAPGRLSFRCE